MAVEPLFHADMDSLKSDLRLTGAALADTLSIIDRVVQEVRYGFYDKLGQTRVAEILGFAIEENPTTTDPLTRLLAVNCETQWVKWRLFEELPVLFMDSSGETEQIWNLEGLTREASSRDLRSVAAILENRVRDMLDDLAGTGDSGESEVTLLEPSETPPRPGDTIFPPVTKKLTF